MSGRVERPFKLAIRDLSEEKDELERAADRRGGLRLLILGALAVAALVAILMPVEPATQRSAVVVPSGEVW